MSVSEISVGKLSGSRGQNRGLSFGNIYGSKVIIIVEREVGVREAVQEEVEGTRVDMWVVWDFKDPQAVHDQLVVSLTSSQHSSLTLGNKVVSVRKER